MKTAFPRVDYQLFIKNIGNYRRFAQNIGKIGSLEKIGKNRSTGQPAKPKGAGEVGEDND